MWQPTDLVIEVDNRQPLIKKGPDTFSPPRLLVKAIKADRANSTHDSGLGTSRVGEGLPAEDFIEECTAFPNGEHDDQMDDLVQGLTYFPTTSARSVKVVVSGLRRRHHLAKVLWQRALGHE